MNLRRLDVRMALPESPRTAAVLGDLPHWREGLPTVGIELCEIGGPERPDLIVAPARRAGEALTRGAAMVILEGRGGRRALRRAGMNVRRFLPLGPVEAPDLLLSLDAPRATAYALGRLRTPQGLVKRARNAGVQAVIALGAFPDLDRVQTVAVRVPGRPFLLERAASLGVDRQASWFQTMGGGDALTRGVFHLFAPGSPEPEWVVKFARVPGYSAPFEADERGLGLVARAGGSASAHAPRLLGRFDAGGFEASAETAIAGEPLSRTLVGNAPLAQQLALVDRIAAWTVELARATTGSPDTLAPELERLRDEVVPKWTAHGSPADLVQGLPALPAVLAHNDLGSWNVIVDGSAFGAVDWESARPAALPLWDLLYFAVDALTILDGARTASERANGSLRLLKGEAPLSGVLFRWVTESARAIGVPVDAVGAVSTLCWLHHGLSHVERRSSVLRVDPGAAAFIPPAEQIAARWLADPALGVQWPAWRSTVTTTG